MRVRRCWSRAAVTLAFVSAVFGSIGCAGQSAVPAAAPVLTLQQDGTPRPLDFPGSELPGSEPTGFERVATVGGVEVFEQSGVPFISIAGQGRFPAPPAVVQKVLLDFPRHAQVLERLADCEVLERGDGRLRIYQRLALPVVDDRDYALDVTWGQGEAWRWIRFRLAPDGPPSRDGVVRVIRNRGGWDLRPIDDGNATLVRHRSEMDMGGVLPSWMASGGATDELPLMFQSMCKLLPERYAARCGVGGMVALPP